MLMQPSWRRNLLWHADYFPGDDFPLDAMLKGDLGPVMDWKGRHEPEVIIPMFDKVEWSASLLPDLSLCEERDFLRGRKLSSKARVPIKRSWSAYSNLKMVGIPLYNAIQGWSSTWCHLEKSNDDMLEALQTRKLKSEDFELCRLQMHCH